MDTGFNSANEFINCCFCCTFRAMAATMRTLDSKASE